MEQNATQNFDLRLEREPWGGDGASWVLYAQERGDEVPHELAYFECDAGSSLDDSAAAFSKLIRAVIAL